MNNEFILNILFQVLGQGKKTARNNYAFKCPNGCNPSKHKLEINLQTQQYQCWVCGSQKNGLKGKSLVNLFKSLKVDPDKIKELKPYINNISTTNTQVKSSILKLPKEFKPLINISDNDITGKHALNYIKKRGLTENDIIKYNIGYCEGGKYNNMIIIPSYDSNGNLNYFTARNFDKTSSIKYKNPDTSRNIIPFELFINWEVPIVLCEGMFDAIAIKRNAVPLLGKNLQSNLMKKIVTSVVKKIYIALDKDALKEALQFCEQLINEGKEVYLVDLDGKDPSELGFKHFTELISNTYPLTFSKLFEKKINLI